MLTVSANESLAIRAASRGVEPAEEALEAMLPELLACL